jgi:hypothetical protein
MSNASSAMTSFCLLSPKHIEMSRNNSVLKAGLVNTTEPYLTTKAGGTKINHSPKFKRNEPCLTVDASAVNLKDFPIFKPRKGSLRPIKPKVVDLPKSNFQNCLDGLKKCLDYCRHQGSNQKVILQLLENSANFKVELDHAKIFSELMCEYLTEAVELMEEQRS